MPWVRLEDTFPEHPKIDAAGGDAAWLHVCALAYCNRNTTDGFIATARLAQLSDRKSPARLAARLVEVGLWEVEDGGWRIHDYLDYQPSKAAVEQDRENARNRMRRAREQRTGSGNVRANNERSSEDVRLTRPDPSRPDPALQLVQNFNPAVTPAATDVRSIAIDRYAQTSWDQANQGLIRSPQQFLAGERRKASDHPDLDRWIAEYPTASGTEIASWLRGEKQTMRYHQQVTA